MNEQKWAAVYVHATEKEARRHHGNTPTAVIPWPSSGVFDREKARDVLIRVPGLSEGPFKESLLEALAGCVVPDPRLARIAALPAEVDPNGLAWLSADDVAEILGGGPA